MKVLTDDPMFAVGSYPGQRSDGLYMDGMLVELVNIYSRNIVKDNQFTITMGSSTFGVRTGKSTVAQQIAYFYTKTVNKMHGLNLKFDHTHIVFNSKDLIKRAYEVPRYSALILDEGDDLTEHGFSRIMKDLQKFFRKSGQLNLFVILILPDFHSLPKFLAMNRTNAHIDVKFEGEFDRGYFEYYNFTDKKKLYVKGKKFHDFSVQPATLQNGRFVNKYCVNEEKYRKMKHDDLVKKDEEEEKISAKALRKVESEIFTKVYKCAKLDMGISTKRLSKWFGRSSRTGERFLAENMDEELKLITTGKIKGVPVTATKTKDTISLADREGGERSDSEGGNNIENGNTKTSV